ncbi:BamA/TamA family outer membrane protein [Odoribacter laneus]|uniref:BamA/TamA family outer membrane protein n=1 Tax=Odoribacter laneus TaxID=626933 RepID=UPI003AB4D997
MKIPLFVFFLFLALPAFTQQDTAKLTVPKDTLTVTEQLTARQLKQLYRQHRRDSIRAHKKVWLSILGGPSYNPEASLGIGGAMLMTFRMNKYDSLSQRSFIPVGFNISINGTFVAAGAGTLFFNENKFRIYIKYGYRTEPANFYGIGYDEIKRAEELRDLFNKDSVTFHKASVQFFPRFVWEIRPNIYVGTLLDYNYYYGKDMPYWMKQNPQVRKYGNKYHNIGIGGLFQYDTRDDVATPFSGIFLSAMGTLYGKYLGGDFNYEMIELEYRQFKQVFKRRSVLAWTAKSQIGIDNVPYTELPNFGNPFDLRGYAWGKYRDKSMTYGIVEYRHMFMSEEAYKRGAFWSKFGAVAWVGTGAIGKTPVDWDKWKFNYGVGLRIQLQPRKNFRLDIGKEPGQKWGIYMNMTEAF